MRTKGHATQLEHRSQLRGKRLAQGKGVREVARLLDVALCSVRRCPSSSHCQWILLCTRRHPPGEILLLDAKLSMLGEFFSSEDREEDGWLPSVLVEL